MKTICNKRKTGGFVGMLMLVISVGIMALLFSLMIKNEFIVPSSKDASGIDENAIKAAEQAKNMIENNNKLETGAKN